jgi:hypothetical protein
MFGWEDPYHWFFDHGVPGNLTASVIAFVFASVAGYFTAWKKRLKPHMERTAEIHRHLDTSDPYQIGEVINGTEEMSLPFSLGEIDLD